MKKKGLFIIVSFIIVGLSFKSVFSHCDTMDGPVIADARKAIDQNNLNYVLKWIQPANEKEIMDAFNLSMKVRTLGPEAKELSDRYFFETLVRIHREGEGLPYTGVKPSGTPIDERIKAADKSIEEGNLTLLEKLVPKDKLSELKTLFEKVMSLKNFNVNDVKAGREYIEAYVQFFHFAEGEEESQHHEQIPETKYAGHIPWILTGIFMITSVLLGILYARKK